MKVLIFILVSGGAHLALSQLVAAVYMPAASALRLRAPRRLTQTQVATAKVSALLEPHIDLEPIKRLRLAETLKSLGRTESPEMFTATALARALLPSIGALTLMALNPVLGVGLSIIICAALYQQQIKTLDKEMAARRQRIERELPQFASTIRQSLNATCDVVGILESYRKVCGPALRTEIDHTLNDMVTGNPEHALKTLEGRVASPKLGQLTRGLVAVLRGDDQRLYFDMLASEYRKSQNEEVAKALLKRPEQLTPNMVMIFAAMVLMIVASVGTYLMDQMGLFF